MNNTEELLEEACNIRIFTESKDMGILYQSYRDIPPYINAFLDTIEDNVKVFIKDPKHADVDIGKDITKFKNEINRNFEPKAIEISEVKGLQNRIKDLQKTLNDIIDRMAKLKNKIAFGGNYLRACIIRPKVYNKEADPEGYSSINKSIRTINRAIDWCEKILIDLFNMTDQDLNILTIIDKLYRRQHIYENTDILDELIDDENDEFTDNIMESYKPKNIKLSEDDINLINDIIPIIKEEMSTDCAKMEFTPMTQKEDLNNITKSKIGGVPYWPEDMKWPTEKGRPLILAIQINFAELPPEIKFNYPTSGILQVFIDPNIHVSKFNSIPSISIFHQSTDKLQSSNIPASTFTITPKIDVFATCKLINTLPSKDIINFNKESRIYYHDAMKNAAKKLNIDFKSTFIGNDNTGTPIYHALEDYFGSVSDDDFSDFVNYVSDNVIAGYDLEYHMSPNLFTLSDFKSRTLIGAYYYPDDNHEVDLYQYDISGFSQNYNKESTDIFTEAKLEIPDIDEDFKLYKDHGNTFDKSFEEASKFIANEYRKYLSTQDVPEWWTKGRFIDFNFLCNNHYIWIVSARVSGLEDEDYNECKNILQLESFVNKYKSLVEEKWPGCTIGVYIDEDYALYVLFDETHFASDKLKDAGKKAYDAFSKYVTDAFEDENNPMRYEYINLDENTLKDSKTYHVAVYLRGTIEDDPWDLFEYYDLVPKQKTHEAWDNSLNKVLNIINNKFNIDKALNIIKNSISEYNGIRVDTEEDKYGSIHILLKESSSFTESKSNNSAHRKSKERLTSTEYAEVHKIFGDVGCSFAKDKDGYYCYTHRARSDSYPTIAEIPKDKVDFIVSTG